MTSGCDHDGRCGFSDGCQQEQAIYEKLRRTDRLICPTGKSVNWLSSPLLQKYSAFPKTQITSISPSSRPIEGRIAIVTNAGRDAVDAGGAADESAGLRTAKSCGPDAPTLASSWRKQFRYTTVANKPGHRGEHEGNR
jgi:hypothetical protein